MIVVVDSGSRAGGGHLDLAKEAARLVAEMSLEEKAALTSGLDFWHTKGCERLSLAPMMMTDGPHGLRKQAASADHLGLNESVPATCFPTAATLGSSWDPSLLQEVGRALGAESADNGVGVLLGPGVNIKRSPLCGRNFEYFSEDPILAGRMATALVKGIQSRGVGASLKHFAVNNQETDRMRVDARLDERTLREIYLPAFEATVKDAHPRTVMCSYNRINGEYASQSKWLLTEILRDEWGFEGLVVSDWGAVDDRVRALAAGLDLEMPASGGDTDAQIVAAVRSGAIDEAALDAAARRVVALVLAAAPALENPPSVDYSSHHELARRAAAAGAVLLKNAVVNDHAVLPFNKATITAADPVVVIGEFARKPRYQGAGSSQVAPRHLVAALDEFGRRLDEGALVFEDGFPIDSSVDADAQRERAVQAASGRRAVIFLGLPETIEAEGYDRDDMRIPRVQLRLLGEISKVARECVIVLSNGASIEVADMLERCDALLECWLGGEAGGAAIVDILLGTAEPGGRLAESLPARLEHVAAQLNFPGEGGIVNYGEGIFVGYRGLDAQALDPVFPFGFGLSYTLFSVELLDAPTEIEVGDASGRNALGRVRVRVGNVGDRRGSEVVQLYLERVSDSKIVRAPRSLVDFAKVELEPNESTVVDLEVSARSFAHWDVGIGNWLVEPGYWRFVVARHSRDRGDNVVCRVRADEARRPLDRESTLSEWIDDPIGEEVLRREAPGLAELVEDPKSGRMMGAIPLMRLVTFPGMGFSRADVDRLLHQVDSTASNRTNEQCHGGEK